MNLPDHEAEALRRMVEAEGIGPLSVRIGVHRQTIMAAMHGHGIRNGSASLIRAALPPLADIKRPALHGVKGGS